MTPEILEFGQFQKLTDRLRELVRKYPKGVGIFKEFLQNADDARATTLKVILDCQTYPSSNLPRQEMAALQGPSLVFINDKPFSEEDWQRIQQIGNSGKAHDVQKTGRFGLGFNSVYNVTDHPMLLTNDRLGVFDPHRNTIPCAYDKPGAAWRVEELWQSDSDLLAPFQQYGLSRSSRFGATIFRLPLRTVRLAPNSEISSEGFTKEDFNGIVEGIVDQGCGLILFLNSLLHFDIEVINKEGRREPILSMRSLNTDIVDEQREKLRRGLDGSILPPLEYLNLMGTEEVYYRHDIQVTHRSDSWQESWSVVRGLYDAVDLVQAANEMEQVGEKAVPLAGATIRLDSPVASGLLSCALPLPAKSGIPIHIDGYFDLQDSREDLHQDNTATGRTSQTRAKWNETLLSEGCAVAAASLLQRVGLENGMPAYDHWPKQTTVANRLVDSLPMMIYERLAKLACLSAGSIVEFVQPTGLMLAPTKLHGPLLADRLLIENPPVPQYVFEGFKQAGSQIADLTPGGLRQHYRSTEWQQCAFGDSPFASLRRRDWIIEVLEFCLKDDRFTDFDGVPLALMSDGTLRAYRFIDQSSIFIGDENERRLLSGSPELFVAEELQAMDTERLPGVVSMTLRTLVEQLPKLFDCLPDSGCIGLETDFSRVPTMQWLIDFYDYCVVAAERETINSMPAREVLQTMPVVPDSDGDLWGMSSESTPIYEADDRLSHWKRDLFHCASRYFVMTSGQLGASIKKFRTVFCNGEIQAFSPKVIADCLADPRVQESFLADTTVVRSMLKYLASKKSSATSGHTASQISRLPIFPSINGELTAISPGPVYVSAGFDPPAVRFDVTLLDAEDSIQADLFESLGARKLSRERFVYDFFLESLGQLASGDQLVAMTWFRAEYYSLRDIQTDPFEETFSEQVARSPIILCDDGIVRTPREVYHPKCRGIADILGTAIHYPHPATFSTDEWLGFFSLIGMVSTVRAADVVEAIDNIISRPFTPDVANQINKIANFIEEHWGELHDKSVGNSLFVDMLNAKAWLPVIAQCPGDYPAELFLQPNKNLYAPQEISSPGNRDCVASVVPVCRFPLGEQLTDVLRFQILTIDQVLQQFDNAIKVTESNGAGKQLAAVFESIYQRLGRTIPSNRTYFDSLQLGEKYRHRKCVIGRGDRMWAPRDCYKSGANLFLGLRTNVSFADDAKEAFASALGRQDSPKLDDYRRFFIELANRVGDGEVQIDQRDTLVSAYQKAAGLSTANELSDCPVLTANGTLRRSNHVLINDASWIAHRAREAGVEFLHESLGAKEANAFAVGQLSAVVTEKIVSSAPSNDEKLIRDCERMNATIQSPQFANGLYRLMPANKRNRSFVSRLGEFRLEAASSIETLLCWDDDQLAGSEGTSDVAFHDGILYTDSLKRRVLQNHTATTLATRYLAEYDIGNQSAIEAMLEEAPSEIDSLLDQLHVANLPEGEKIEFVEESLATVNGLDSIVGLDSVPVPSIVPGGTYGHGSGNGASGPNKVDGSFPSTSKNRNDEDAKSGFEIRSPKPRDARSRVSASASARSRRAVTYVSGDSQLDQDSSEEETHRTSVDKAAVDAVVQHEREEGRLPTAMEHFNEGYDIESQQQQDGEVVRFIEVKGLGGPWSELGVKLTPAQIRFGGQKGDLHWLYIIEFAQERERQVIHKIQNPVMAITDYRFDSGWKQLCTESTGKTKRTPKQGSRVLVEQQGEGTVTETKEYGKAQRLQIQFDSGDVKTLIYPSQRITVLE